MCATCERDRPGGRIGRAVRTTRPVDAVARSRPLASAPEMAKIVLVGPRGQVVCERCDVADHVISRVRGLLGRRGLPRGQGLLIKPTWSVHTWFMRFPIDVVFLDRDLSVLKVRNKMRPWRMAARFRAHSVLELAAGECERLQLDVGDRLAWGSPKVAT